MNLCSTEVTKALNVALSVTPRRGDWTDQELCQLERIRAECSALLGFELECAHTYEGDPWFLVYDRDREQVVLHIARIDRRYVMARASWPKPLTVASLSAAVDAALDELYRAGSDRRTASDHIANQHRETTKRATRKLPLRAPMALDRLFEISTAERQAIFLGETEPRATRSQKAAVA